MKIKLNQCADAFDFLNENGIEFVMTGDAAGKDNSLEKLNENIVKMVRVLILERKLKEFLSIITGEKYEADISLDEANEVLYDFFTEFRQQSSDLAVVMLMPNPAGMKERTPFGNTKGI